MNRFGVVAMAAAMLLPVGLNAQRYPRDRDRGDHDARRGRVAGIIADLERRTDDFKVALRRALDHSRMDGTRREDVLNRDAARLEQAANRLRDSWNADRDFERSRHNLRMAISAGQDIQRTMSRHRLRGGLQREWAAVRQELNMLADVFREPRVRWD